MTAIRSFFFFFWNELDFIQQTDNITNNRQQAANCTVIKTNIPSQLQNRFKIKLKKKKKKKKQYQYSIKNRKRNSPKATQNPILDRIPYISAQEQPVSDVLHNNLNNFSM